jgi:hypothetical protein
MLRIEVVNRTDEAVAEGCPRNVELEMPRRLIVDGDTYTCADVPTGAEMREGFGRTRTSQESTELMREMILAIENTNCENYYHCCKRRGLRKMDKEGVLMKRILTLVVSAW